ncbi:MAG TPA: hypothetical protein VGD80_07050 [Kofleriaceae bacterium]
MSPNPDHNKLAVYIGRIREFDRNDWLVYLGWVGLMLGLVASTGGFWLVGHLHDVPWPAEAAMVPIGALVFTGAIAIDTIGHRTIYKQALKGGEQLVHHITIVCGVASCVLLMLAYDHPGLAVPAMAFTAMSFVYSLVDEVFHWRRYTSDQADTVEMWSHVGIFIGHGTMMIGWWRCFQLGYPGVKETLAALGS